MTYLRLSQERGPTKLDWLDSRHTFSFAHYHDPKHMGFGVLRVINEDIITPGAGFDMHGHENMEIISYVIEGALEHKDSEGNSSIIRPGEVQLMSAGTGIRHSEFNHYDDCETRFLQVWVIPNVQGTSPGYQQKMFSPEERQGKLRLVVSPDGAEGSLEIKQDARLYISTLDGNGLIHETDINRKYWVQVVRGSLMLNDQKLAAGDGIGFEKVGSLNLAHPEAAEILLFDLP